MRIARATLCCMAVSGALVSATGLAEPPQTPAERIAWFAQEWDDEAWLPPSGAGPTRYMRTASDNGWKLRFEALQHFVATGNQSVDPLLEVLQSGTVPQRILAAQALGYLAPQVPVQPLLETALTDKDAAVRLHCVDAVGMSGSVETHAALQELRKVETNGDVKKHLDYALARAENGLEAAVAKQLVDFDLNRLDTARIGEPAPDFELTALTGEKVRLSDYRGHTMVVLVFIYGDT